MSTYNERCKRIKISAPIFISIYLVAAFIIGATYTTIFIGFVELICLVFFLMYLSCKKKKIKSRPRTDQE